MRAYAGGEQGVASKSRYYQLGHSGQQLRRPGEQIVSKK